MSPYLKRQVKKTVFNFHNCTIRYKKSDILICASSETQWQLVGARISPSGGGEINEEKLGEKARSPAGSTDFLVNVGFYLGRKSSVLFRPIVGQRLHCTFVCSNCTWVFGDAICVVHKLRHPLRVETIVRI